MNLKLTSSLENSSISDVQTPLLSPIEKSEKKTYQNDQRRMPNIPKRDLNFQNKNYLPKKPIPVNRSSLIPVEGSSSSNSSVDLNNNLAPKSILFSDKEFSENLINNFYNGHYVSPHLFYIIPETRINKFRYITDTMKRHSEIEPNNANFTKEEIRNLTKGTRVSYFCYVKMEFRRAIINNIRILENEDDILFDIHSIDEGNDLTLKSMEIRKLCPELAEIPELKIKCGIHNLKPFADQNHFFSDRSKYKWDEQTEFICNQWLTKFKKYKYIKVRFYFFYLIKRAL